MNIDIIQSLEEVIEEADKHFDIEMKTNPIFEESDRPLFEFELLKCEYNRLYIKYTLHKKESTCTK